VQRFTPEFIEAARPCRHALGDRWFVDETYLKVAGKWADIYRAVDQHGQVIDVLLSARRDLAAVRRFFIRALRAGTVPVEVTTDCARVYPRVLDGLVPSALHIVGQCANNLCRSKMRLGPVTCGFSVSQAACAYSLIRPPRTDLRWIRPVSISVTVARGASRSASGTC